MHSFLVRKTEETTLRGKKEGRLDSVECSASKRPRPDWPRGQVLETPQGPVSYQKLVVATGCDAAPGKLRGIANAEAGWAGATNPGALAWDEEACRALWVV